MGFPYGIIAQKPPEIVAAPPLAEAAVGRRQAVWERVRARAHRQSVGLRTAQADSEDAEQTRELEATIVEESGEARDREAESTEGGGPSVSLTDIEHTLMHDSEEEEEGASPSAAGGEGGGAGSSTDTPRDAEPTYGTHERGIYRRVIARAAVSACRGVATRGQRWVPSCLSDSERLASRLDRNKRYFQWYRRASADVHRNTKTRVAVR